MKMTIDVRNRHEGDAIRLAMDDPEIQAQLVITGLLLALDEGARVRVLATVDTMLMSRDAQARKTVLATDSRTGELRLHSADAGV